MNLEKYLNYLRWEGDIGIRAIRVRDMADREDMTCYDIILIPEHMDGEDGAFYRIESDIDGFKDVLLTRPDTFLVFGAWNLTDLIKGAMYMEDMKEAYFESEV